MISPRNRNNGFAVEEASATNTGFFRFRVCTRNIIGRVMSKDFSHKGNFKDSKNSNRDFFASSFLIDISKVNPEKTRSLEFLCRILESCIAISVDIVNAIAGDESFNANR